VGTEAGDGGQELESVLPEAVTAERMKRKKEILHLTLLGDR
jgi:hypothetical protein